ncbi:MAG: response regulator [Candidatus Lokiarchaeota archaeon]|nr:response regulator [Candidatus Lokiarchaeota archaeon]
MKTIDILLVEDNPGDIRLFKEAFKNNKIDNRLHIVEDGVEALSFLRKEGKFKNNITPDLMLLDIDLPKKNGYEVLDDVKKDKILKNIPVVILTITKVKEKDLTNYKKNVVCFLKKPENMDQFIIGVQSIFQFLFLSDKFKDIK